MIDKAWRHCTESSDKINTAFVWATVTSGSFYTQAAHITSLMDIPTMSTNTFHRVEKKIGIRQQSSTRKRLFAPREKTHPDKHYGPESCDPIDIDEAQLKIQCEERLAEFQKPPENIALIVMSTVGQHENDLYTTHRWCDRLTASQFGVVSCVV